MFELVPCNSGNGKTCFAIESKTKILKGLKTTKLASWRRLNMMPRHSSAAVLFRVRLDPELVCRRYRAAVPGP